MPTRHPRRQRRVNLICWSILIVLVACGSRATWAQSVSQARLYPTDGRAFGSALASSGNTLAVGNVLWNHNAGQNPVGAVSVFTLANGLFSQQAELIAGDGQPFDLFGSSVAVAGSMIAVGAPYHNGPGAVYVFTQNKSVWSQTQEVTPADGVAGDYFGCAVTMTKTTLAVGAYRKNGLAGTIYLYALKGAKWTLQAEIPAPNSTSATPANFGFSLSLSGTTLLVGAPGLNSGVGAAYLYTQNGSTWTQQAQFTPGDGQSGGQFGYAVALSGSMAAVGSPQTSGAYVYQSGSGGWSLMAELNPFEGTTVTGFGTALTLTASTLVVSALNTDDRESYIFTLQKGAWTSYAELNPFDSGLNGGFGVAVAIVGSVITISRPYASIRPDTSTTPIGMVYAFSFGPEAQPANGLNGDSFGYAVAVSGATVVCGAPGRNDGVGAAYVYTRGSGTLGKPTMLTAANGKPGDYYGAALACNGATLAVGAPNAANGLGAVYLYAFQSGKWKLQAELTASDGVAGDLFGDALSLSGSVLAVGAPGKNGGMGAAYVFTLSSGAWSQQAELTASDGQGGDNFGLAVGMDGNNLLIGAPNAATTVDFDMGAAYLFTLSAGQWTAVTKLIALDGQFGDGFGTAVGISGGQIAIGAPGHNNGVGAVYPFTSSASGWVAQPELAWYDLLTSSDQIGAALALSSSTLVVGAYGHAGSMGTVQIYTWTGSAWILSSGLYAADGQPFDTFGAAVALSGVVIVVGAPNADYGNGSLYTN